LPEPGSIGLVPHVFLDGALVVIACVVFDFSVAAIARDIRANWFIAS
jgi:hypothetical protein